MHEECTGTFENAQQVVDKVRMMGFSQGVLPEPLELACHHCGAPMVMRTFEFACPACGAVHGVTPCHSYAARHVRCAGPGY